MPVPLLVQNDHLDRFQSEYFRYCAGRLPAALPEIGSDYTVIVAPDFKKNN